jgi:anti-sigma-K factor RskA
MNHTRFEELKDAYVLGTLAEEERREFEEYLAAHPERQAEIEELGAVAGLLALSPHEHEPPPELRSRILDAVGAEAVHAGEGRRSGLAWLGEFLSARNLALGAAALLVIGLFSWNMLLRTEMQDLQRQTQELQASQDRTIVLHGSGVAQEAHVELVALEGGRAVLMAKNMPPVPEDRTIQIWVIKDGDPKSGGLFEPDREMVATAVTVSLHGGDVLALTIEPEGGSPNPTSDPMMTAKL